SKVSDVPVYEGDRLIFETAGSGGVGDPLARDPEAIAKDVCWNLVSREAAGTEYGVVLNDEGTVDDGATEKKREELKSGRGELLEFDHGPLPSLDEQRATIARTRHEFSEWLSGELGAARGNGR
ncbi:MAG: hydantoinase B/oxoprolinase family protein, partial [Actinobacteria bacterium]|nr:hydantoinase B/oxoprolinase family protein [Actinomycetota bacterium]